MSYPIKDTSNNMVADKKGNHSSRNTSGNSVNHPNTPAQGPSVSESHNIQASRDATHAPPVQTPIVSALPFSPETEILHQRSFTSESTDAPGNDDGTTKQSGKSCAGYGSLSSSPCRETQDTKAYKRPGTEPARSGRHEDSQESLRTQRRSCEDPKPTVTSDTSYPLTNDHEETASAVNAVHSQSSAEVTQSLRVTSFGIGPEDLKESSGKSGEDSNTTEKPEENWSVVVSRNKKRLEAAMSTLRSAATGKITLDLYLSKYDSVEFEVPFRKLRNSHLVLLGFQQKDKVVYDWRCLAWARNYFLCPGHPKRTNVDLEIQCACTIIKGRKIKHPWNNICAFDLNDSCSNGAACKRCHLYIPEVEEHKVLLREAKAAKELKQEEPVVPKKQNKKFHKSKKPSSHTVEHQEETKGRDKCKNFFAHGFCRFGDECHFSHDSEKLNVTSLNSRARIELKARIASKAFHHHLLIERIHMTLTASIDDMNHQLDIYEANLKPWAQHKNDRIYFHDIISGLVRNTLVDSDRRRLSRFYLGLYDFASKRDDCTNKFRLYEDELEQEIALVFIRSTKKMCPKFFEKQMKQWRLVENLVVPQGIMNDSFIPKECICSETCSLGTHSFEEYYSTDLVSGEEATNMSICEHDAHIQTPAVRLLDTKIHDTKALYDMCINQLYAGRSEKKNMPEHQPGETYKSFTTRTNEIAMRVTNLAKTRELLSAKLEKLYFERYCSVKYGFCLVRDGGMLYVPYFNQQRSTAVVPTAEFDLTTAFPEGYGPGSLVVHNPAAIFAPFSRLAILPRKVKKEQTYDEYMAEKKIGEEKLASRLWMRLFKNVTNQIKQIVFVPHLGKKIFQKNYIPDDIILCKEIISFRDEKGLKMREYIKLFKTNRKIEKEEAIKRHFNMIKRRQRMEARKLRTVERPEDFVLIDRIQCLVPLVRELKERFAKSELDKLQVSRQFALKLTHIIRSKQAQAKSEFIAELSRRNILIEEAKAIELAKQKIKAAELREAQMEDECGDIRTERRRECLEQNAHFVNKVESSSESDSDSDDDMLPNINAVVPQPQPQSQFNIFSRSFSRIKHVTYVLGIPETKLKSVLRFFKLTLSCGGSIKKIQTVGGKVNGLELQGLFVEKVKDYLLNKNTSTDKTDDESDEESEEESDKESEEESGEESDEESEEESLIRQAKIQQARRVKIERERLERIERERLELVQKAEAVHVKKNEELAKKAEAKQMKKDKERADKAKIAEKIAERERERLRIESLTVRPVVLSREERDRQIAEQKTRRAEQLQAEQAIALEKQKAEAELLKKGKTINTGKKAKGNRGLGEKGRLERKNYNDDMEYFASKEDQFINDTLA